MTSLHRVYAFYSRLGHEVNPDNAYIMTRMQFWRLLKDCQLHYDSCGLVEMDRWLGEHCLLIVPCSCSLLKHKNHVIQIVLVMCISHVLMSVSYKYR